MLTQDHMKKIWIKMTRIYGHKWVSNFGDSDDGTWFHALKDLPIELIKDGLEACLTRSDSWPPSLPEFRSLCLDIPNIEEITNAVLNRIHNPVADYIRAEISPWDFSHRTEKELRGMIRGHYDRAIREQTQVMIEQQQKLLEAG